MSDKITIDTPSATEITTSRVFDAPRELVWAAHTRPEHVRRWWGRGNPLDVEMDFRVGGRYRFVEHSDGQTWAFRGEYLEIEEPRLITQTFEFEGMPGHITTDTLTLTEEGGRTTITTRSVFASQEDRDGMLQSGMTDGMAQSYAALDKLLAELS